MDGKAAKSKQESAAIKMIPDGPYRQAASGHKLNVNASERRKFEVRCNAGDAGHLAVASDSVSVQIGQRIRKEGKEEFWGSLLVECKEQDDGSLAVEVVVFHPDWEEPRRIAAIQSNPSNGNPEESSLRFDFKQKQL